MQIVLVLGGVSPRLANGDGYTACLLVSGSKTKKELLNNPPPPVGAHSASISALRMDAETQTNCQYCILGLLLLRQVFVCSAYKRKTWTRNLVHVPAWTYATAFSALLSHAGPRYNRAYMCLRLSRAGHAYAYICHRLCSSQGRSLSYQVSSSRPSARRAAAVRAPGRASKVSRSWIRKVRRALRPS